MVFYWCLLLWLSPLSSNGQDIVRNGPPEEPEYLPGTGYTELVMMLTDRDLYFAGDMIRFSVVVAEGRYHLPIGQSSIIYIELLDPLNNTVAQTKIAARNARGHGGIKIPKGVLTGNYVLRAYTNWMRNGPAENYFHTIIPIINPEKKAAFVSNDIMNSDSSIFSGVNDSPVSGRAGIDPQPEKPSIQILGLPVQASKREKVSCEIKTSPGAYIIASAYLPGRIDPGARGAHGAFGARGALLARGGFPVRGAMDFPAGTETRSSHEINQNREKFLYPPELRSDLVSGRIREENIKTGSMPAYYVARLGYDCDVQRLQLNADGSFYMTPGLTDTESRLLFLNDAMKPMNIVIENEYSTQFSDKTIPPLLPEILDNDCLDKLYLSRRIQELYDDQSPVARVEPADKFYGTPDETIHLSDYIKLPVMEEFFRELSEYTIITRDKGTLVLNVLSKYTNRILGPDPFYMVDGIPVFETSALLDLPPERIKSINIKANDYLFGNILMNGIVDIETYDGDGSILNLGENVASYLYEPVTVEGKQASDIPGPGKMQPFDPDQRTELGWEPMLVADDTGNCRFDFSTSDITGEMVIEVTVVRQDGTTGQVLKKFLVR